MSKLVKIPIDEIDAELSYEGWIQMKAKIMGWMLQGKISWDEGTALRSVIDNALSSAAGVQAKEQYFDENRSDSNIQKTN